MGGNPKGCKLAIIVTYQVTVACLFLWYLSLYNDFEWKSYFRWHGYKTQEQITTFCGGRNMVGKVIKYCLKCLCPPSLNVTLHLDLHQRYIICIVHARL